MSYNPASSQVQVSMILSDDKINKIRVEDLMGKVIFQRTYSEQLRSQIINTINFAAGIYLITIDPEVGVSKTEKLVITH